MDLMQEFLSLLAISSPSHGERAMADCLKEKLLALGCRVYEDDAGEKSGGNAGNLIAKLPGTGAYSHAEPLLFAAHMDRVPGGDDIHPVISEEKITSDGSTILAADDLSGVAAILAGVERVLGRDHCPLEIVFTVSEELRTLGAKYLDYSKLSSKYACCMDSSGRIGRIVIGAPAIDHLQIEVLGKKAHAGASPEKGINALKAAAAFLSSVREGRLDPESTANYGVIRAGEVTNVVCDHVLIRGEARSHREEKLAAYEQYAEKLLKECVQPFGARAEFQRIPNHGSFYVAPEEDIVKALLASMEEIGVKGYAEIGGGGMDANTFFAHGIRTVGVATGYLKNHTSEEELYLDDFRKSADLVETLILVWSQREKPC